MSPPVFGVIGWKNSGKTTLVVRLIEELTRRGLTVSAIKHAHHSFEIDHEGRDSWRFSSAGARRIAVVSSARWAMVHELRAEDEPEFSEVLAQLGACDLVLVEGYKGVPFPKIEARRRRSATKRPLTDEDPNIVAIASDTPDAESTAGVPVFALDDIAGICDFIEIHSKLVAPADERPSP